MAKKKIDKGNLPTVVETGNNPLANKDEIDTICGKLLDRYDFED